MIKIENITKKYGEKIGNFGVNIEINQGETYGIVGPNGAGKTTLIRQIVGLIKPDQGEILIGSLNAWSKREKIMNFLGYIPGELNLYENMTGYNFLKFVSEMHNGFDKNYIDKLISFFKIDASRKIKKMSKGMKQKIAIIASVVHKPKILVLDEPTSGLDPIMRKEFNNFINNLKKEGLTIFISSHSFEEIGELCNKVSFMKDGTVVESFELTAGDKNNFNKINDKFDEYFAKVVKIYE